MAVQLEQLKSLESSSTKEAESTVKKVAVVGATGYTGQELVRLLLQHDRAQIHTAVSQSSDGKKLASVYPGLQKHTDLVCSSGDLEELAEQVDLLFLALPHGNAAGKVTKSILAKCKVIDLGADFRLKSAADYETWYKFKHPQPELLAQAVYGLPELNRAAISQASLVANPGCYATCSILTLAPLLQAGIIDPKSIIIDAKSGVSGAGRAATLGTPEIEEQLAAFSNAPFCTSFTPHLVPMNRGILVTAYASLISNINKQELYNIYSEFYENELFIRLFSPDDAEYTMPETRFVKGANFCDIGMTIDPRTNRVIAVGALDNLVKGAAGQAIQNMNLLFGWPESSGLKQSAIFPA
jgi:N-acetyl-gamma-glutamyl-phosphate reductase